MTRIQTKYPGWKIESPVPVDSGHRTFSSLKIFSSAPYSEQLGRGRYNEEGYNISICSISIGQVYGAPNLLDQKLKNLRESFYAANFSNNSDFYV